MLSSALLVVSSCGTSISALQSRVLRYTSSIFIGNVPAGQFYSLGMSQYLAQNMLTQVVRELASDRQPRGVIIQGFASVGQIEKEADHGTRTRV